MQELSWLESLYPKKTQKTFSPEVPFLEKHLTDVYLFVYLNVYFCTVFRNVKLFPLDIVMPSGFFFPA